MALDHHQILKDLIADDVSHGFALPLPLDSWEKIPSCSVAPLGMVTQGTIDEHGRPATKHRMTHDQSFPGPSGKSVNNRVNSDLLPPCMFGFCLVRLIHYIVSLRQWHPDKTKLIGKFDLKSA